MLPDITLSPVRDIQLATNHQVGTDPSCREELYLGTYHARADCLRRMWEGAGS